MGPPVDHPSPSQLARELDFPKLTIQVIHRTIAPLGKTKGHVKDIQGMMRHSKASTTTDVYMQSFEPEVRTAINSIYAELVGTGTPEPTPEQPVTFGANAAGRKANHGAFNHARSSTMEPNNGSGKEDCSAVARKGFAICGQNAGKRFGRGSAKCLKRIGGPDRDRTDDLFHAMAARITVSTTYKRVRGLPSTRKHV